MFDDFLTKQYYTPKRKKIAQDIMQIITANSLSVVEGKIILKIVSEEIQTLKLTSEKVEPLT